MFLGNSRKIWGVKNPKVHLMQFREKALEFYINLSKDLELGLSTEGRIIAVRLFDHYSNSSEAKRLFADIRIVRIRIC